MAKSYKMKKEDFLKSLGGAEVIRYEFELKKVIELLQELNK